MRDRKLSNAICDLKNQEGELVHSFEGLAKIGVEHVQHLFKSQEGASIVEIIQIAHLFPRFVEDEDNQVLMAETTKGELLEDLLHSF